MFRDAGKAKCSTGGSYFTQIHPVNLEITYLLHVFYYLNALNPFNNNGTFHIVSLVQFIEDGPKTVLYIYVSPNLANSVGPDELPTYAALHLGHHCL